MNDKELKKILKQKRKEMLQNKILGRYWFNKSLDMPYLYEKSSFFNKIKYALKTANFGKKANKNLDEYHKIEKEILELKNKKKEEQ